MTARPKTRYVSPRGIFHRPSGSFHPALTVSRLSQRTRPCAGTAGLAPPPVDRHLARPEPGLRRSGGPLQVARGHLGVASSAAAFVSSPAAPVSTCPGCQVSASSDERWNAPPRWVQALVLGRSGGGEGAGDCTSSGYVMPYSPPVAADICCFCRTMLRTMFTEPNPT
jgi:hypothetical protein